MYSNLRTEGGRSNHIIIQRPLALANYQLDLVRVIDSNDPELELMAQEWDAVPYFWVRRRVWTLAADGRRGVSINYIRNGQSVSLAEAERDPELARAPTWLEAKFLVFRVIGYNRAGCLH